MANEEETKLLVEKFARNSNLGIENGYMDNFFNIKMAEFSQVVRENYPEDYKRFEDALEKYKGAFVEYYSGKKKQTTPTQMTTNK